ncbi:MAG: hypothetical protein ACK4IU_15195 [Tabrizicola flagellatus]|uniref:hypothetical protein n=1 Tax=Tabrizicola flagellatus TaxID=2593021 RepID=UPI00391CDBAA
MIAGFLLLSAVVGIAATVVAFSLDAPTWVALLAYPVVSSMSLLLWASMWSVRASVAPAPDRLQPNATAG